MKMAGTFLFAASVVGSVALLSAQPQRGGAPAPAGGGAAQPPAAPAGRGAGGRGAAPAAPANARAQAPVDLTGYWVTVVTEDWRYRMMTAPRGDHPGIPLNGAGNQVANAWDPAKDEAAGDQCKAYGAAGVMRLPGRLHITWGDDNTLKVETEAGTQTRLFQFGGAQPAAGVATSQPAAGAATLQGTSVATWEIAGGGRGRGRGGPTGGSLKVVTTHMKPGYLQKNGVPYGENAVQTEYFSRANETDGTTWLILTHIVEDPQYLTQPFIRSTNYKKLPDQGPWEPEACTAR
jgi:hypothetical protein